MPSELTTQVSITIDAWPEEVWEALTDPDTIRKWFFGVQTETDWTVGSPIVHRGEYQGRPYEDKGTIVRVEPERLLVHTHWSPMSGLPDDPANYQEVSWALAERERHNRAHGLGGEPAERAGHGDLGAGVAGRPRRAPRSARAMITCERLD